MGITRSGMGFFPLLFAVMMAGMNKNTPQPTFRGMNYAVGGYNPEFHPRRSKFKGYMREQHIGRRRSKFYFNKNR